MRQQKFEEALKEIRRLIIEHHMPPAAYYVGEARSEHRRQTIDNIERVAEEALRRE
jgi:hypothetical protein